MNHTKKWLSLVLALVLAIALAVPALAAEVTWNDMAKDNSVLAPEKAYTTESVKKALTAYSHYCDAPKGSQAEKDAYNKEFKPAIKGLVFKAHTFKDAPSNWWNNALNYV